MNMTLLTFDQSGPMINSIMEMNPDAIYSAEALDQERKLSGARSLLHGVPVLLKGNIETNDKMHITAGALALENHVSSNDAFLVQKLRDAGAIILAKTNMTEWANGMSSSMWAGYSSIGGQTKNPYGDHFPGGSSTGSAASVENYLYNLPAQLPVHNLNEWMEWNERNSEKALKYGQDMLDYRSQLDKPLNHSEYIVESISGLYYSQNMGIDHALEK